MSTSLVAISMVSFIICGTNWEQREEKINKLLKSYEITAFDKAVIDKEKTEKRMTDTVGIEEVKLFQERLFLKPLQSKQKAVILNIPENITVEAQNALLKSLEEPPKNTIIILSTPSIKQLLPTIISRCKVITLKQIEISSELLKKQHEEIMTLLNQGLGERLVLAEKLAKNKTQALRWLELSIQSLRAELHKSNNPEKFHQLLIQLSETYSTISTTNVNLRLALEILFISL